MCGFHAAHVAQDDIISCLDSEPASLGENEIITLDGKRVEMEYVVARNAGRSYLSGWQGKWLHD